MAGYPVRLPPCEGRRTAAGWVASAEGPLESMHQLHYKYSSQQRLTGWGISSAIAALGSSIPRWRRALRRCVWAARAGRGATRRAIRAPGVVAIVPLARITARWHGRWTRRRSISSRRWPRRRATVRRVVAGTIAGVESSAGRTRRAAESPSTTMRCSLRANLEHEAYGEGNPGPLGNGLKCVHEED
jgi:hypothetical protein